MSQKEKQVLLETETVFPVREGPAWAFHSQDGNASGEGWWGEKNQVQGWPWAGHPSQLEKKLSSEQRRVLPHSHPKKGSGGLFLSFLKSQPGGETADCRQEPCCLLPQALSPTPASQEEACPSRAWAVLPEPLHQTTGERGEYSNRPKANSSMCPGQRKGRISVQALRKETTVREMKRDWVKAEEQKGGNYKLRSEKRNGLLASIGKKL